MPDISVILPNYNHVQYLQQRIDSILNQTCQNFELIIIDDNSTDGSQDLLRMYASHPKISHLIYNEKNSGGPFGSWKRGLELARGEYIWIAESDDWADVQFLECTSKYLDENKNIGIVYTNSNFVNRDGTIVNSWATTKNRMFRNDKWSNDYTKNGVDELLENLLVVMTINNMSSTLIRKEFIPDLKILDGFRGAGDWIFCAYILLNSNVQYIADTLNYYRTHEGNVTKQNSKSGLLLVEDMRVYTTILKELKKRNIDTKEIENKILDRFLFKFGIAKKVDSVKKKIICKSMKDYSVKFYQRFLWMLLKYRIKQLIFRGK